MSSEEGNRANDSERPRRLPSIQEVQACSFSSWYPYFSKLPSNKFNWKSCTIKSQIIRLPEPNFREYLLQDGVMLPRGIQTASCQGTVDNDDDDDNDYYRQSNDDDSSSNSSEGLPVTEDNAAEFDFEDVNQKIQHAMTELGGAVIPKLNWSAPRDAVWVNVHTLKCTSIGDVYLLLKSSDFCHFDVQYALRDVREGHAYTGDGATPEGWPLDLVLRKWCNLYPSQEFRCFVYNHKLIAISQRIHSQYFPHLAEGMDHIRELLMQFYTCIIHQRFAGGEIPSFVFDTYIDTKDRVWLIDFNVWGDRTDPLLFEWGELENTATMEFETMIRVVETSKEIRADPLSSYKAPIDAPHIAGLTGGDAEAFRQFMGLHAE